MYKLKKLNLCYFRLLNKVFNKNISYLSVDSNQIENRDINIVGGGSVGMILGLTLAKHQIKVNIFEKDGFISSKTSILY